MTAGSTLSVQVGAGGAAGAVNTQIPYLPGTSGKGGGLSAITGPGVAGVTANGGGGGGSSTDWWIYLTAAKGAPGAAGRPAAGVPAVKVATVAPGRLARMVEAAGLGRSAATVEPAEWGAMEAVVRMGPTGTA